MGILGYYTTDTLPLNQIEERKIVVIAFNHRGQTETPEREAQI